MKPSINRAVSSGQASPVWDNSAVKCFIHICTTASVKNCICKKLHFYPAKKCPYLISLGFILTKDIMSLTRLYGLVHSAPKYIIYPYLVSAPLPNLSTMVVFCFGLFFLFQIITRFGFKEGWAQLVSLLLQIYWQILWWRQYPSALSQGIFSIHIIHLCDSGWLLLPKKEQSREEDLMASDLLAFERKPWTLF